MPSVLGNQDDYLSMMPSDKERIRPRTDIQTGKYELAIDGTVIYQFTSVNEFHQFQLECMSALMWCLGDKPKG